jgi:hypothetical protein
VFEARKPEYLWLVFWRDQAALEAARTNPVWRDQIKKFEAGKFYKTIPLELVCESLASSAAPGAEKARKPEKVEKIDKAERAEKPEPSSKGLVGPTPEGE